MSATMPTEDAHLLLRSGDEVLHPDEVQHLSFFCDLGRKGAAGGAMALRRFEAGDVICTQGDSGNSAFYIVPSAEIRQLREYQAQRDGAAPEHAELCRRRLEEAARLAASETSEHRDEPVAKAEIHGSTRPDARRFIPNDGPEDISDYTRVAEMREGDVFGEMSCMTYQPRSATIVALRPCYMIEFLRIVYERLIRNEDFRRQMDSVYRERVLKNHLGRLELFSGLNDTQLESLSESCQLLSVDPGELICRQGERADAVYIIRSGIVQVVQDLDLDLKPEDVTDWPGLCQRLLDSREKPRPVRPAAGKRAGQAAAPKAGQPKKGGELSMEEMLAAARGKPPAKSSPPKPSDKPGEMSVEEMLAAARGGKPADASSKSRPEDTPKTDEAKQPRGEMSVEEMLAAARGVKSPADKAKEAEPAATKPKPDKPDKPDKPVTKPVTKPKASAEMSVEAMLAAARGGNATEAASGPEPPVPSPPAAASAPAAAEPLVSLRGAKADELLPFIWNCLHPRVQAAVERLAAAAGPAEDDQQLVLAALNQLMRQRGFVNSKAARHRGQRGSQIEATLLQVWRGARKLLDDAFRHELRPRDEHRPPRILSYMSRGDYFGEMGVWHARTGDDRQGRRTATCIAYDHPDENGKRRLASIELVRIPRHAFDALLDESPELREEIAAKVAERRSHSGERQEQSSAAAQALQQSSEFGKLGLAQGQSLLLIDLAKCTRCGDCITACMGTHDDGRSRLFLDGPQFSGYLIPSSCRQCRDPVCMIGCPVGSIQKGDNGQIIIEDWCIGCDACANQCPYDSIQMHDLGLVPHYSLGWHVLPRSAVRDERWRERAPRDLGEWIPCNAPLFWNVDSFRQLSQRSQQSPWTANGPAEPLCFALPLTLRSDQLEGRNSMRVQIKPAPSKKAAAKQKAGASSEPAARVWINGKQLPPLQEAKGRPLLFEAPERASEDWELELSLADSPLSVGDNWIAVEMRYDGATEVAENQPLFALRLDALPQPQHDKRAVVCDLCSSLSQQKPACVEMCPHDAAIRVNAIADFPVRSD